MSDLRVRLLLPDEPTNWPETLTRSATFTVLDAARAVLFLVAGAEKAERAAEILEGGGVGLPAGRVRPTAGDLIWFLDAPAAHLLLSQG